MTAARRVLAAAVLAWLASTSAHAGGAPQRWTPTSLSTDQYESSPSFTPDGKELFFMRADPQFRNYRLLWSRCEQGRWSPPVPPPFAAAPPVLEGDPFVTRDGRQLYYVSSRHAHAATGGDDLDIWVVDREPGGRWGLPRRLPEPVNSGASELLPRVDAAGRILFGSSRPGGFGAGDIYIATPERNGSWQVDNPGPPISTQANEYEADISLDGRTVVVVADRGNRSHLYRFTRGPDGRWLAQGQVPAREDVFQVGPALSPRGERLLFAQRDGERSGEIFLADLVPDASEDWPPACGH
jgi:Tol biopolymer transport system component